MRRSSRFASCQFASSRVTSSRIAILLALATTTAAQQSGSGEPPETPPAAPGTLADAWQEALRQARRHKAPILAFVLPPADEAVDPERRAALRTAEKQAGMLWFLEGEAETIVTARDLLLRQVQLLRGSRNRADAYPPPATQAQQIFALTVPVFALPGACGAEQGESIVLLGPDGRRQQGLRVDLGDYDRVIATLREAVATTAALAPRRANVPPDARDDLAALPEAMRHLDETCTWTKIDPIEHRLRARLPAIAPALITDEAGQSTMSRALWLLEAERPPLGSTQDLDSRGLCMGCGMGWTPLGLSTVLKLIGP